MLLETLLAELLHASILQLQLITSFPFINPIRGDKMTLQKKFPCETSSSGSQLA